MIPIEQALAQAMHHISQNNVVEAEKAIADHREKYSLEPQLLHTLGLIALKKNDLKGAIAELEKAIQIDKQNPLYLANLGEFYRRDKRYDSAMEAFEKALLIMPEFLKAHLGIANTLKDQKKYQEAISRFRLSLAINPGFAQAYNYLGLTLMEMERPSDAVPLLRKAVALRENYYEAHLALASALEMTGQPEEALEIYQNALEKMPKHIGILNSIGSILRNLGKMEESVEYFEKAMELDPNNVATYYNLSRSKVGSTPEELEKMEKMFDDPRLNQDQKRSLHFTMGKIYDDNADYPKAFDHFKKGNDLDDRDKSFDARMHHITVSRVMSVFNKEFFANRKGMGSESTAPIFIVGVPRSGTTLVEQTLASHPNVYGAGELAYIGNLIQSMSESQGKLAAYPENVTMLDAMTACRLGEDYVSYIRSLGGKSPARITDKMPGNFMNLGIISLFLPRAKIINCQRNLLDISLSCYFQHFAMVMPFSLNLSDMGHYCREYVRVMDHWHKVLPSPVLDVSYDDMVADHEGMTKKILDFVELEWDDSCLDFHKTKREVRTASTWQVRQPVYNSSIDRWKNYDEFLKPLREAIGEALPKELRKENEKIAPIPGEPAL
ncbi:MAG: tetratricopeptide repeat protein [Desulfobacteraceae bacterium]|nr:tetratricopeptide repeat protein [Desulfobacteraceae bacterium]